MKRLASILFVLFSFSSCLPTQELPESTTIIQTPQTDSTADTIPPDSSTVDTTSPDSSTVDKTPPVLDNFEDLFLELNSDFIETITAVDHSNLLVDITVSGEVDSTTLGTYTLVYTATDSSGNTSTATRVVTVEDTTPPVLDNFEDLFLELNSDFIETITAVDHSNLLVDITVSGEVDSTTLGTYTLVYTATDSSGNTSTATRVVTVEDTTPPTISLIGSSELFSLINEIYVELGVTSSDNSEQTVEITISGSVIVTTAGEYTLKYTATDTSGNSSSPIERMVTVEYFDLAIEPMLDVTIHESNYTKIFNFVFSNVKQYERILTISTSDTGAIAGDDYILNTTEIVVPSGVVDFAIGVEILNDDNFEGEEIFDIIINDSGLQYVRSTITLTDISMEPELIDNLGVTIFSPALAIIDGNLIIASLGKIINYDLATNSVNSIRIGGSSVVDGGYFGGVSVNDVFYVFSDGNMFQYDNTNNSFFLLSNGPLFIEWAKNLAVIDGKIIVAGGKSQYENSTTNVLSFDPDTLDWEILPSLNSARYGAAFGVVNDELYVFGGSYSGGTVEFLGTSDLSFSYKSSNSKINLGFQSSVKHAGKFYIFQSKISSNSLIQEYDYLLDTWREFSINLPSRNYRNIIQDGPLTYVVGGMDNSGSTDEIYVLYIGDDI